MVSVAVHFHARPDLGRRTTDYEFEAGSLSVPSLLSVSFVQRERSGGVYAANAEPVLAMAGLPDRRVCVDGVARFREAQ